MSIPMPEQTNRAGAPRAAIVAAILGALIAAAFGRVWLRMATKDLPAWRAASELLGWTVLGLFVIAGVLVALRILRAPPQWRRVRPRLVWAIWFGALFAAEVTLIVGGQRLLSGTLGHPEWITVWTLFVVGAHFWPFALILRIDAFHVLAGTLCAMAVVSAVVAGLAGIAPLWSALPGFGAAAVLWGFSGWALHRMALGRL